jgi:hypothetical protein
MMYPPSSPCARWYSPWTPPPMHPHLGRVLAMEASMWEMAIMGMSVTSRTEGASDYLVSYSRTSSFGSLRKGIVKELN